MIPDRPLRNRTHGRYSVGVGRDDEAVKTETRTGPLRGGRPVLEFTFWGSAFRLGCTCRERRTNFDRGCKRRQA